MGGFRFTARGLLRDSLNVAQVSRRTVSLFRLLPSHDWRISGKRGILAQANNVNLVLRQNESTSQVIFDPENYNTAR